MASMIKIGLRFFKVGRECLQRAGQMGVHGGTIRFNLIPGVLEQGRPDAEGVRRLKQAFASFGLELGGMELSRSLITGVLRGEQDRAAQELDRLTETIRLIGGEGLGLVTCGFSVAHADEGEHPWRGYIDEPGGQAGTLRRTFDAALLTNDDLVTWGKPDPRRPGVLVTRAEVFRRMDGFMEHVLPVARAAGVRLAFHPNDPPMPLYRGVEQPFVNPEGLAELLRRYDDPHVGLLFCMGTMHESGADMPAALRRFGEQGKISCLHFRNVRGTIPRFHEVFPDEGDYDPVAQIRTLHAVGYDGYLMPDHYPGLTGDTTAHDMAVAWTVGYFRALIQATKP
ncbi:MAG: mannonate dehydratase [Actinobacteria bacterium]|nr:mannonate dehydratase [Actinomycetota bacterium]